MTPAKFTEQNIVFAEDQPEYSQLPAHATGDIFGTVYTCWRLTPEEVLYVAETGCVWVTCLTFGRVLQPLRLAVEKPAM
jgi:hypothetical protein